MKKIESRIGNIIILQGHQLYFIEDFWETRIMKINK